MSTMITESLLLLLAVFALSAAVGWALAGKPKRKASRFDASLWEDAAAPMNARPQPVAYLDAAAEHFTSGVVVPFKTPELGKTPEPKSAYAPPVSDQRYDMAADKATAGNVAIVRDDQSLQRRISSLAGMTPESVAAAVQQAGSGLEPVRLKEPKGEIDDLTVISGIGGVSQDELHALGIFHFWQIAGWTPEHVAWVSSRISTPGRISRENWMSQAAKLAKLS